MDATTQFIEDLADFISKEPLLINLDDRLYIPGELTENSNNLINIDGKKYSFSTIVNTVDNNLQDYFTLVIPQAPGTTTNEIINGGIVGDTIKPCLEAFAHSIFFQTFPHYRPYNGQRRICHCLEFEITCHRQPQGRRRMWSAHAVCPPAHPG